MDLARVSRQLNKRLGGGQEMFCSRAFRSRRRWLIWILDTVFWLIDGKPGHCRNCYRRDHPPGRELPDRLRRAGM